MSSPELIGRTVLIPGASRPIGRAIGRRFSKEGASLILPVFDWPDSIAEMEKEFSEAGSDYLIVQSDLREPASCEQLAVTVKKRYGSLDFLINNIERGGMPVVHGSYDLPHNKEQWDLEFATTVKSKWLLFHNCLPIMGGQTGGAVINISSISSATGRSGSAAPFFSDGYSAANRAISSFTETWARQAAPAIRVNELNLGLIRSRHGEGTRGWSALTAEEQQAIVDTILLQRTGFPEEVADAVYFLAVKASYMTGAVLTMDGGYRLGCNRVPAMPPGIL